MLACAVEKCKQEGITLPSSQASLHGAEALLAQSLDRRSLMMVLAVRPCNCDQYDDCYPCCLALRTLR